MQKWLGLHLVCVSVIITGAAVSALIPINFDEVCGETVDLELVQGRSLLLKFNSTHVLLSSRASTWECHVTLRAPPVSQLMMKVLGLNLPGCSTSFDIYGGSVNVYDALALHICTSSPNKTFVTPGNRGSIVVISDSLQIGDVTVLVTSFYTAADTCRPNDFLCSNKRCVSGALQCNGYDNCGDGSDCKQTPSHESSTISEFLSLSFIMPIVFFSICFLLIAFTQYRAYKRRMANTQIQMGAVGTNGLTDPSIQIPLQTGNVNQAGRESGQNQPVSTTHQVKNQASPATPGQPNHIIPGPSVPQPHPTHQAPAKTHQFPFQSNQISPLTNQTPPQPHQDPPPPYQASPSSSQAPTAPPPSYEAIPGHVSTNQSWEPSQQYRFTKWDK